MTSLNAKLEDISGTHVSAAHAVAYAIASLEAVLAAPRFTIKASSRTYSEMRRDMPYVIHTTAIPGTFLLVNRNYKPVGNNLPTHGEHVKYEEFKNLHVRLTPQQIASVVSPGHSHGLFGDANPPWSSRKDANAYLARLKALHAILAG